jgi:hypothetical protein
VDFVCPIEAVIPGAQGRLLAALARISAPVTLRTAAELAGVSPAQCSQLFGALVDLGIVEREDVPPAAHFRLVRDHVAATPLLELLEAEARFLAELRRTASRIQPKPVSVVAFGSLVRGQAGVGSDVDVLMVRTSQVDGDDAAWRQSVAAWVTSGERMSGNPVNLLEVDDAEAGRRLQRGGGVWTAIREEGRTVYGLTVDELRGAPRGKKRSSPKRVTR